MRLGRGQNHFALLLVRTGDDHQTTNSWAITENTAILVGTKSVPGTVFQEMKTLLVDSQP